jgi:ATP-binding cassette, subfamily B, bacterial
MMHWAALGTNWGDVSKRKLEHVTVGRILRLFAPYKMQVGIVLVCILISAALGVVPAYLTAKIIDIGIVHHNVALLLWLTGLALTVTIISGLIGVLQSYLNNLIGQRVMADMREQLYRHLIDLSLRFFGKTKLGDLMSRFNNDIGGIQNTVTSTYISIISNVLTLFVGIVS